MTLKIRRTTKGFGTGGADRPICLVIGVRERSCTGRVTWCGVRSGWRRAMSCPGVRRVARTDCKAAVDVLRDSDCAEVVVVGNQIIVDAVRGSSKTIVEVIG